MNAKLLTAVARRLALMFMQMLAVVTIVFLLVRLFLDSPARALAGQNQSPDAIAAIEQRLGLDEPLAVQFWKYVSSVLRGDLGDAFSTGNPVVTDLVQRVPTTLFLVTLALTIAGALALLLAFIVTLRPRGWVARLTKLYGFVAGALPDFWLGLALIFVVYYHLQAVPAPAGQIDPAFALEPHTHIAVIDALLAQDVAAFADAFGHLVLPLITLVVVYMGPILRLTVTESQLVMSRDFIRFGQVLGLRRSRVTRYALRQTLPTFVTILGTTYGFLLGGAVLVESVFSWGGAGQYAVSAVSQSDYAALQGFVIVAGLFTAFVYALVDVMYQVVDPGARS
jgi:ABC-type dipeptide/oligopeptide/nickel transport system permease component